MRKMMTVLATVAVLAGGSLTMAGPASAAVQSNCGSGAQMCLFYHSQAYGYGAEYGTSNNVRSFNPNVNGGTTYAFKAGRYGSAGAGQSVWNNAGAAGDYSSYRNFAVWYSSGWTGVYDVVPYGKRIDLTKTYNNDASMGWI